MNELKINIKEKTELSVKQQKEIKHELIDKLVPYDGHTIWEVNNKTQEIKKALFSNVTYTFGGEIKREIITKKGYTYIGALNKKNALKKFKQGKNGSKYITINPLEL